MSGFAPNKKPEKMRFEMPRRRSDDPCDLQFRTDLVGLRSPEIRIRSGDLLAVVLAEKKGARSVVCRSVDGHVVGALAAFQGLAQLMKCLSKGIQYVAIVEAASKSQCTVMVQREAA